MTLKLPFIFTTDGETSYLLLLWSWVSLLSVLRVQPKVTFSWILKVADHLWESQEGEDCYRSKIWLWVRKAMYVYYVYISIDHIFFIWIVYIYIYNTKFASLCCNCRYVCLLLCLFISSFLNLIYFIILYIYYLLFCV